MSSLLVVSTAVERLTGAAAHWRQEIHRDQELLVKATVVGAITDLDGRPRRIPPGLRQGLEHLIPA